MAYEKTNWQTGDIVSSERLNKIEQGIYDAPGYIVGEVIVAQQQNAPLRQGGEA